MCVRLEGPRYLTKENLDKLYIGESVRALVNLMCGNMEERNKYWLDEEERLCIFCEQELDCMCHYVEKCYRVRELVYGR